MLDPQCEMINAMEHHGGFVLVPFDHHLNAKMEYTGEKEIEVSTSLVSQL